MNNALSLSWTLSHNGSLPSMYAQVPFVGTLVCCSFFVMFANMEQSVHLRTCKMCFLSVGVFYTHVVFRGRLVVSVLCHNTLIVRG